MRLRYRPLIMPFLASLLLALLPAATRSHAASTIHQTAGVSVSGTVELPGGGFANGATVRIGPRTPTGDLDSAQLRGTLTDFYGNFSFNDVGPGDYGIEVTPPDNQPAASVLRGASFTVPPGTAPVNLGSIRLPPATKQLVGRVTQGSTALGSVYVYANNSSSSYSRYTLTAPDGSFGFGLEPGDWSVYVGNRPGAAWQYTDTHRLVSFAADTTSENRTLNLAVQPTNSTLKGRVLTSSGQPLTLPPPTSSAFTPYVYAYGDAAPTGRYEFLDASGTFTMPVIAGSYSLYVVLDKAFYPIYAPPPPRAITATPGVNNIGTLTLETRDSVLAGVVRDAAGAPVVGAEVEASRVGGFYQSAFTDANGSYSMAISAASWDVEVLTDPALGFLDSGSFAQVTTVSGASASANFVLSRAAATLQGGFVDATTGAPLYNVTGWAYARDAASDEYVAEDAVEYGSFSLNVPAGALQVGVQLAPGSRYSVVGEQPFAAQQGQPLAIALSPTQHDALELAPFEREVMVTAREAGAPAAVQQITLPLAVNHAVISGPIVDQRGNPIVGVAASVGLAPTAAGDAAQWAEVDPTTGSFSASVHAGTWYLLAEVDDERAPYSSPSIDPPAVQVASGATATRDMALLKLDGNLTGTVLDEAGLPLAGQLVFASSTFFSGSATSDANGAYAIAVPLLNPDGGMASYELGADFTCDTADACYLDGPTLAVSPVALLRAGGPGLSQGVQNITATKATGTATLRGRIARGSNPQTVKGGEIGGGVQIQRDDTDSRGNFEVKLIFRGNGPELYSGHLLVGSKRIDILNVVPQLASESARLARAEGPPQLAQAIDLPELDINPAEGLPRGVSAQFENANGWSTTLSDGTRVEIAPGSVPLNANDGTRVRVTVSPTINIFPTAQHAAGGWYGIEVSLTAISSNRPISEELLAPARLTLRYGGLDYALNAVLESRLRPARLLGEQWEAAPSFLLERGANRMTFQTRALGTWALVQQRGPCQHCVYLPVIIR